MTESLKINYNKGVTDVAPIRCTCGRVIAYIKGEKVYIKCRDCRQWIAVLDIEKVQESH